MPTIYDIPKKLLNPAKKDEFIGWLKRMPAEDWVKRELAQVWKSAIAVDFDAHDYKQMGL